MNVLMNGLQVFLQYINDNWTFIVVIIGLLIAVIKKIRDYISKSDEEKIALAKRYIQEGMLKLVADAELDFSEWNKAGSIKRSQVIQQIFKTYPILEKVVNQNELIAWIDEMIDEALVTLRDVIKGDEDSDNEVDG